MTDTTNTAQIALQTALQTLQAAVPVIVASTAPVNPNAALTVAIVMSAAQSVQHAIEATQGNLTPAQTAAIWATINAGVQAEHDAWAAMGSTPSFPVITPETPAP